MCLRRRTHRLAAARPKACCIKPPVAKVHRPVDAQTRQVHHVDCQHPCHVARDQLGGDARQVARRYEGDELPTRARGGAGVEPFVSVQGPREPEAKEHDRFQYLCHDGWRFLSRCETSNSSQPRPLRKSMQELLELVTRSS